MKVGELIEQLQQLDPELHVFVSGYEGGFDYAGPITPPNDFALNFHDEWYYGDHELVDSYDIEEEKYTIVKGIIL